MPPVRRYGWHRRSPVRRDSKRGPIGLRIQPDAIGALSGFAGSALVGWLQQRTGSFAAGLAGMVGFLLLAATLRPSLPRGSESRYRDTLGDSPNVLTAIFSE